MTSPYLHAAVATRNGADLAEQRLGTWWCCGSAEVRDGAPDPACEQWLTVDESAIVALHRVDAIAGDAPALAGVPRASGRPHRGVDDVDRYLAEQASGRVAAAPPRAGGLYMIAMNVDPTFDAEFNLWYDEEHLPRLSEVPGVLLARRFRTIEGPRQYFAVYHLTEPEVVGSPDWLAASNTPWTDRARAHTTDRRRLVCRPHHRSRPSSADD